MAGHRDEEGYSVAPVRLGGGASRAARGRRRLGLVAVILASLGILGVAIVGPRLSERPHLDVAYFATPTPSPTPSPTPRPTVTPLPAVTLGTSGPPRARLPLLTDALRRLDLSTGELGPGTGLNVGTDAIFAAPAGDGWICICLFDSSSDTSSTRDVELIRLSPDGIEQDRIGLATLTGDVDPDGPPGIQTDVAVAPDLRTALLVVGRSSKQIWQYSAARIDLVAGSMDRPIGIGEKRIPKAVPLPSSGPDAAPTVVRTDVSGPVVRRSPDGRSAFAWVSLQQYTDEAQLGTEVFGWRIELDGDGSVAAAQGAKALSGLPAYCSAGTFMNDDRFVSICPGTADSNGAEPQPWDWLELDAAGAVVARASIPGSPSYYADQLVDRANGAVWLWDPISLVLVRVADDGRQVDTRQYPSAEVTPGDRSISSVPPSWARPWSAVVGQYQTVIAGSPDGRRLYLLAWEDGSANGHRPQASLGVLVVDPATFAIVDRWAPQANYNSLQLLFGGSVVAAAGAPQIDAAGADVPWEASLTLHDASDGKMLARYGHLGEGWYSMLSP